MPSWKDWAQLVRIPNTLTACADALAGFSLGAGLWTSEYSIGLICISVASISLYWAGMVLNDVNDVEQDTKDRRRGPIVEERIDWGLARRVGWGLLIAGVVLSMLAGFFLSSASTVGKAILPGFMALGLAFAIVAYDSPLKKTILGPWLMGLCRALNLGMGVALAAVLLADSSELYERLGNAIWIIPLGHGLFVVGITLAARKESKLTQSGFRLAGAWSVGLIGIACIAISVRLVPEATSMRLEREMMFPLLIGLLATPWAMRAVRSVRERSVFSLVMAIKQGILTILFLDAAIALQFAGNAAGLVVCALAIPTFALGRWFRMT